MKNSTFITASLIVIILVSCAPAVATNPSETPAPTSTSTLTPAPTATPTLTPTLVPTATPYGGGKDTARVAIFTELEPDDTAAGYIRIADIDINKEKLVFSSAKLRVGTKPGSLNYSGYGELYPPHMRWSPNGNYLAYTWFEDGKGILYVYDYVTQKSMWEFELRSNRPSTLHFTINWSADSNWAYIEVDSKSYYILNVANGTINNLTDIRIQSVEWHANQAILFFESSGQTAFFQYDPVNNQTLQIEPKEFDPAQVEKTGYGSWNTYGQYSRDNDGYLFETGNEYNGRSYYLVSSNDPIFELVRIDSNITREDLGSIDKIVPSPDKSSYLIAGTTHLPFNEDYETFYTSVAVNTKYPLVFAGINSANGIYPFSWSPDGKSFIGYQEARKVKGEYIIGKLRKMVIVDAATNSIVQEYELNYDQVNSIYGYSLRTAFIDSTGPLGIDIYWQP